LLLVLVEFLVVMDKIQHSMATLLLVAVVPIKLVDRVVVIHTMATDNMVQTYRVF
jgi:hypothetical protein